MCTAFAELNTCGTLHLRILFVYYCQARGLNILCHKITILEEKYFFKFNGKKYFEHSRKFFQFTESFKIVYDNILNAFVNNLNGFVNFFCEAHRISRKIYSFKEKNSYSFWFSS